MSGVEGPDPGDAPERRRPDPDGGWSGPGLDPDPAAGPPEPSEGAGAAPLPLLALAWFFALDGVERLAEVARHLWAARGPAGAPATLTGEVNLPLIGLWGLTDGLLVVLLLVRAPLARLVTGGFLAFHAAHLAWLFAVRYPEVWLYAGAGGRLRLVATVAIDALFVAWLVGPGAARALAPR